MIAYLALAVALAASSLWWYARREEPVRGRGVGAALRVVAILLLLTGPWLPSPGGEGRGPEGPTVLLDVSRSMGLPAGADSGGISRLDSARRRLGGRAAGRILAFGRDPRPVLPDSVSGLAADASATRLAPALDAAARSGADSVLVLTDGELEDPDEAAATARSLGLGVRETRVAEATPRLGIAFDGLPRWVRSGDSARIRVRLTATGAGATRPDSVEVELWAQGDRRAARRVAVPSAGRSIEAELPVVLHASGDSSTWVRLEARLPEGSDPFGTADRSAAWIEVTPGARGAVLVSADPGWESRFLLPLLERVVTGGARGYLRAGKGRFLRLGPRPEVEPVARVARDAREADLLVVVGPPRGLPAPIAAAARAHPRRLLLPEESGGVPGTSVTLTDALSGEWFPAAKPPASPVAPLLAGISADTLPPLAALFGVTGSSEWSPLSLQRERRGPARPALVAGAGPQAGQRWAVAAGAGYWRWAFREGQAARLYDGLFGGVVGWLLQASPGRPVEVEGEGQPVAGRPLRLRIAPGVRRLRVTIADSAGRTAWSDSSPSPPSTLATPPLTAGRYRLAATGLGPAGEFRFARPLELSPGRELQPTPIRAALEIAGRPLAGAARTESAGPVPVWPFALAAVILCAEWAWRRRVGLR